MFPQKLDFVKSFKSSLVFEVVQLLDQGYADRMLVETLCISFGGPVVVQLLALNEYA